MSLLAPHINMEVHFEGLVRDDESFRFVTNILSSVKLSRMKGRITVSAEDLFRASHKVHALEPGGGGS